MPNETPLANQAAGNDEGRILTLLAGKFELLDGRFDGLEEKIDDWIEEERESKITIEQRLKDHDREINSIRIKQRVFEKKFSRGSNCNSILRSLKINKGKIIIGIISLITFILVALVSDDPSQVYTLLGKLVGI